MFGRAPRGIWIIVDKQIGESHGQLRSVPLLRALGVDRFSFANGWRGLDLVPYEWVRVAADTRPEQFSSTFPICQIVSQAIEQESDGDAAYTLLRAWRMAGPDALLVYLFDTDAFTRARDISGRAFWEEYDLERPRSYGPLARRYASEMVAGVLVRDVQEYVDRDLAYLIDDEPGGAGVCELLLDAAEGFAGFRPALRVAAGLADCSCDDGCPRCLFQYGCSRRNTPHELSRRAVAQFAGAFDRLELVEDAQ